MEKFAAVLQELAQKLGQTVEALWPHAVRYVVVDGLVNIAFALAFAVVTLVVCPRAIAPIKIRLKDTRAFEDEGWKLALVSLYLVWFAVPAISLLVAASNVTRVFEPVGYLLAQALTVAGGR